MADDDQTHEGDLTVRTSKWRFLYFLFCFPAWRKRTWTATDTGIVARSGILSRNETRIPWSRITDKTIQQGIFGRIFNFGNISLETAGDHASSQMTMTKIGNAERFYEVICERTDRAAGVEA
jgi:uncharacterized membrane protein YdbT with pleckstrin-like domain